jgi:hypothetical protein
MKKQSLVIIMANLAIVALLAVTATFLVNKGKSADPQTDTTSHASTSKTKPTPTDTLDGSLDDNEKDITSVVNDPSTISDEEFPTFSSADFE